MVNEEIVQDEKPWYEEALEKESDFDGDELWKAKDDSNEKITLLGDPDLKETADERKIAVLPVEVGPDAEKRAWIVNRKYGDKAPYMQICKIVAKHGGVPENGLVLQVIVTGKGQNRQYTILDPSAD